MQRIDADRQGLGTPVGLPSWVCHRSRGWYAAIMALLALALLVLVPALPGGPAAASDVHNARVGFSPGAGLLWESDADLARDFDLMATTGAGWVRLDLDWASAESTRGQLDWGPTDRVVNAAEQRGLQVLLLPAYTPEWARPAGTTSHAAPASATDFARFVGAAAERYSPRGVHTWEVWNEPNLASFWSPRPDPAGYARLLSAASGAIHAVDPSAAVLLGGLAPATDAADRSEISPVSFLRAVYDAGVAPAFQGVAVHPYSYPALPMDPTTADWNAYYRLPLVRELMVARGDVAKKVWLTEFGAPTGRAAGAVSEDLQARIVRAGMAQTTAWSWTGPLFYYAARDAGVDPGDREDNFGLVRRDFSPKPALTAFAAAVSALPATPPAGSARLAAQGSSLRWHAGHVLRPAPRR